MVGCVRSLGGGRRRFFYPVYLLVSPVVVALFLATSRRTTLSVPVVLPCMLQLQCSTTVRPNWVEGEEASADRVALMSPSLLVVESLRVPRVAGQLVLQCITVSVNFVAVVPPKVVLVCLPPVAILRTLLVQ